MPYRLQYNQSFHERYDTDMNTRMRDLIESHGATVVGESGGCGFGDEHDQGQGDQEFEVEATHANILTIQRAMATALDRQVRRNYFEVTPAPHGEGRDA